MADYCPRPIDDEAMGLNADPRLRGLITYQSQLVNILHPVELMDHLRDIINEEGHQKIKRKAETDGDIKASRVFLDEILYSNSQQKYSKLMDALRACKQEKAIKLLEGIRNIKSEEIFTEFIDEVLRPSLITVMVVDTRLLDILVREKCITQQTKEKIKCHLGERERAASELLDEVKKLLWDWPPTFVKALRQTGNERVINLISPDFLDSGKSDAEVIEGFAKQKFPSEPLEGASNNLSDHFTSKSPGYEVEPAVTEEADVKSADDEGGATGDVLDDIQSQNLTYQSLPVDVGEDLQDAPQRDTDITNKMAASRNEKLVESGEADVDNEVSLATFPGGGATFRQYHYDREFLLKINRIKTFDKPKDWHKIPVIIRKAVPIPSRVSLPEKEDDKSDEATGGAGEDLREKHDDEDTKEKKHDELALYDYQKTLAQPGLEGKNTIIIAPTGSGKTIIAAEIMKDHLKERPGRNKVMFLVCEVALANQQYQQFCKFLSEFKPIVLSGSGECGADDKIPPIKVLLTDYDIIVLTAQLLVNAMISPKDHVFDSEMDLVKFDDFSMMVFDECHHTGREHPYNRLMGRYIDLKLEGDRNLPQVLGLTASLGVGKAPSMAKAMEHVVTMCANLDAEEVSSPNEEMMKQIHEAANKPTMETTITKRRNPDPFLDIISRIMSEIERKLKLLCAGESKAVQKEVSGAPAEKGSQPYVQWISRAEKPIMTSTKLPALDRQRGKKYLDYLKTYNRALLVNSECRTRDALEYLKEEFLKLEMVLVKPDQEDDLCLEDLDGSEIGEEYPDDEDKDEEQLWLEKRYQQHEEELLRVSEDPRYKNPMLEKLKEMVLGKFPDEASKAAGRGIIFVQTREMTTALCRWMQEDEDLQDLNPYFLVGANAKDPGSASMTQTKQLNILDFFKTGEHKVLVATSVAEEGLDIQKCNWVIRYNYVTNEIAMVQSRGRARADNSSYEVLTGGILGAKKAQKENLNKLREKMMTEAIRKVKTMEKGEYKKHVLRFQTNFAQERKIMAIVQRRKKAMGNLQGPYWLICKNCTTELCCDEELRLLAGTHHSVLSPTFKDRYVKKIVSATKKFDNIEFIGKIFCKKCFQDLGVIALYKNVEFPLLKISNVLVQNILKDSNNVELLDENGQPDRNRKHYRQWKDIPFIVKDISEVELTAALSETDDAD